MVKTTLKIFLGESGQGEEMELDETLREMAGKPAGRCPPDTMYKRPWKKFVGPDLRQEKLNRNAQIESNPTLCLGHKGSRFAAQRKRKIGMANTSRRTEGDQVTQGKKCGRRSPFFQCPKLAKRKCGGQSQREEPL